jgi:RNA polymerase sigma-B factor
MASTTTLPAPSSQARADALLFERYRRDGDAATREEIVKRFLGLARHLAVRYERGEEREDVMQVAAVGLMKAIERYDPARGIAFSSFAVPTILGEIKRYFRDLGWTVRVPRDVQELSLRMDHVGEELSAELGRPPTPEELAERCDVSVEQVIEARSTATAHHAISLDQPIGDDTGDEAVTRLASDEAGFRHVDDADEVDQMLLILPPQSRRVLNLRFREERLQREIAEIEGISQMQVSRVIARSLRILRDVHAA